MQRGNFFYFIAHCCFLPNLKENQLCAPHTIFLSSLIFSKQWKIFTYLHFPSLISIIFLFTSIKYNLRASPTLVYNALYLHMWRAKMKIKCSSISLFNPSKTRSACTLFTNSSAELKIRIFKFFFFFFLAFILLDFFLSLRSLLSPLSSFLFPSLLSLCWRSRRRSGLGVMVCDLISVWWWSRGYGCGVANLGLGVVVCNLVSAWWWSRGCGCGVVGGLRREARNEEREKKV